MERSGFIHKITAAFQVNPAVALVGPRQCGKTTLAKKYAKQFDQVTIFDLEDPLDLAKLDTPRLTLENLKGLIIIDEVQRRPELFPILRVLIDSYRGQQRYLILGSASRDLLRQSSESLAGRIAYIELTPFTLTEVGEIDKLWLRGGFPPSYLADDIEQSTLWRRNYIKTFLEQDIPNLGIQVPAYTLRRFWTMLLHYHGNIFNASEIGRSLGLSNTAIRHYLDILEDTFMVRQLRPWFENISKRQVKSTKVYFRDSGIMHTLMGINDRNDLRNNPKLGASWEGFALEEIIRYRQADAEDCYFWSTHAGAELDLMLVKGSTREGFEFKYTDQPKLTPSMKNALEDLKLDRLTVIVPVETSFPLLKNRIQVIGLNEFVSA